MDSPSVEPPAAHELEVPFAFINNHFGFDLADGRPELSVVFNDLPHESWILSYAYFSHRTISSRSGSNVISLTPIALSKSDPATSPSRERYASSGMAIHNSRSDSQPPIKWR